MGEIRIKFKDLTLEQIIRYAEIGIACDYIIFTSDLLKANNHIIKSSNEIIHLFENIKK